MGEYSDYKKYDEFTGWDLDKGCRNIVNQQSKSDRRLKPILRRQRRSRLKMQVKRIINDEEYYIDLTDNELMDAYFEQQQRFDEEDVAVLVDDMDDEDFLYIFKIDKENFKKLVPDIAILMRKMIDKYDIPWTQARTDAIEQIVERFNQ